jgi:hypothetical protein
VLTFRLQEERHFATDVSEAAPETSHARETQPVGLSCGIAFFAYLSARGAAEGFYDQGRDQKGDVRASDVGARPEPAEPLASGHRARTP